MNTEKYMITDIGILPADWDVRLMSELTTLMTNGFVGTVKNHYVSSGVLYIQGYNVEENSFNLNGVKFVSNQFHAAQTKSALKEGDLLTVQTGDVGVTTVVPKEFEGANCHALIISRFKSDYDSRFWCYWFNSFGRKTLAQIETGSTMKHINVRDMLHVRVPVPNTKEEQHRIATALSDTDELIIALEKLLTKKRAIKQGAMQELLTGKRRLPGFSGEWVEKQIGNIGYPYSGLTGKRKEHFGRGNAKYITFLNVLMNTIIDIDILELVEVAVNEKQNAVQSGDLFFNTSSETPEEVGMCAILTQSLKNTFLNSFCFGFRLTDDEIDGLYLSYFFNSNYGRKIMMFLAQGATRYNLSKVYFNDTVLTLPTKKEQAAIADVLSDMDAEIDALTAKLHKLRNIKQGMMSELLTGRIRLLEVEQETAQPTKIIKMPKAVPTRKIGHNQQFDDAVMIAGIVNAFYSDRFRLGRKKIQKLLYLLRRHQDENTAAFKKKAAGPYADEVRYKGGEPIARSSGYIATTTVKGKGTIFARGKNMPQALDYIRRWNKQTDIQWLLDKFLYKSVDDLELLATVDMAICDLTEAGISVSVDSIKHLIATNKEWRDKLKKQVFEDRKIAQAIRDLEALL